MPPNILSITLHQNINFHFQKHKDSITVNKKTCKIYYDLRCDSLYDIPTTRARRATSFGYGNKTLGLKIDKNIPEPASYRIMSEFEDKKKGISFGEGR